MTVKLLSLSQTRVWRYFFYLWRTPMAEKQRDEWRKNVSCLMSE